MCSHPKLNEMVEETVLWTDMNMTWDPNLRWAALLKSQPSSTSQREALTLLFSILRAWFTITPTSFSASVSLWGIADLPPSDIPLSTSSQIPSLRLFYNDKLFVYQHTNSKYSIRICTPGSKSNGSR